MDTDEILPKVLETSYPGNIGAMEVVKFFKIADYDQKIEFDLYIESKMYVQAWELIQDVTQTNLIGKEFHSSQENQDGS